MPPKSKARKDRKASGEAAKQQAAEEEKQQQDEKSSSRADDESEAEDAEGFEDAEGGDEEAAASSKGADESKATGEDGQPSDTPAKVEDKATEKPAVEDQPELKQDEPVEAAANGSDAAQTDEAQGESAGQTSAPVEVESTPAQPSEESAAPATSEEAATSVAQSQPPPPPPRPAPIDTKKAEDVSAPATAIEDAPRKRSQSSLWDRLRSPAEKAAAQQQAESSISPGPTTLSPTASSSGQASPSEQRRPSYRALSSSSILNSLTSAANYAATSAASRGFAIPERLGGAAAMPSLSPNERRSNTRLPRHQVDEAQLMEDQMRFAEARHTLSTSSDREVLRQLGKDLESAYRSKLAEVTSLRVDLEDVSSSVEDIQDENGHLREQMAQLSEEIARREEDLEGFQRLTVAHQERERELWRQEGVEERERLEWKEREAVRGLAEERAINAQLRLALFAQIRDGATPGSGAGSAGSRLSVLPGPSPGGAIFESSSDAGDDSPDLRQQQRLSRGEGGSSGGEESTRIQEDILFNLSQAHTANGGGDREGGDGASTPTRSSLSSNAAAAARHSSLLSDVVPLDQLRLLLSLDEDDNERDIGGGGGDGANGTSDSLLAPPPSHLTRSASPGQAPTTMSTLSPHLQTAKRVADYQLSQALQLENLSLRSQLRDAAKRYDEKDAEVATLREKVAGMEEAIAGLLEGGGA